MPTQNARIRLVMYGIMNSDTWSCGVDIALPSGLTNITQAQLDAFAEQAWTDAKSQIWSGTNSLQYLGTTTTRVLGIRAYLYQVGGAVAIRVGQSSSAAVTCNGTTPHPNQVALCVSLLTNFTGKSQRGRMYLPANAVPMQADGHVAATTPPIVASQIANWLSLLITRSVGGQAIYPAVASEKTQGLTQITRVRCDDVADTIRARRNKLVATVRSSATVVIP